MASSAKKLSEVPACSKKVKKNTAKKVKVHMALILSHSSWVSGRLAASALARSSGSSADAFLVTGCNPICPKYLFWDTKYQTKPITIPVPAAIKPYFHLAYACKGSIAASG